MTGFLGPNGAGKSTTLRVVTGLTPATAGTASVNGTDYRKLANPGRQVGVLLDASAQHSGRTGREVLGLSAQVLGVPKTRVGEMLELVGLNAVAAKRRVGNYSLGMRQRLGLAQALMGDPSTLILDEPANGLDPEGIYWMRGLLRDFADRGGTVLLSSHLLREIEAIADHLVVIGNGRIAADGSKDELLAGTGVVVRGLDPRLLHEALSRAGLTFQAAGGRHGRRGGGGGRRRPRGRRGGRRPARAAPRRRRRSRRAVPRAHPRGARRRRRRRRRASRHGHPGPPHSARRRRTPARRSPDERRHVRPAAGRRQGADPARARPPHARRDAQDGRHPLRQVADGHHRAAVDRAS